MSMNFLEVFASSQRNKAFIRQPPDERLQQSPKGSIRRLPDVIILYDFNYGTVNQVGGMVSVLR